jgi:hypothetical protein
MSFIHCYQYLKKLHPQPLSHLDSETIVKYEKLLKTEDRIDSSKGYTKDNVWVISMKANSMKSDSNYEDFKKMADSWKQFHENGYDLSHLEQTNHE